MDEFRDLLRARLAHRGDMARLSESSGIASHVIGRWRDGVGRPTDTNLRKLAPALGVPYAELARMCGYVSGEPLAPPDARRQAVHAQVEQWLNDVRPEDEELLWAALKAQGESAVDLIRLVRTAVNAPGDAAVNAAVSGRGERGRNRRKGDKGPLRPAQHRASDVLDAAFASTNRRRVA